MKKIVHSMLQLLLIYTIHAQADPVFVDTGKPIQLQAGNEIGVQRIGEGEHWLYLKSGKEPKRFLWKSFWGRFEIIADPETNFIAFQDIQRFGQLSPVIVVHYSQSSVQFIHQTPGNFSLESSEFNYKLKSFTSGKLQIGLIIQEFTENSSRPNVKTESVFTVSPNMKKVIVPSFYTESDVLFTKKPFTKKSP
jgi:hypothetical protein